MIFVLLFLERRLCFHVYSQSQAKPQTHSQIILTSSLQRPASFFRYSSSYFTYFSIDGLLNLLLLTPSILLVLHTPASSFCTYLNPFSHFLSSFHFRTSSSSSSSSSSNSSNSSNINNSATTTKNAAKTVIQVANVTATVNALLSKTAITAVPSSSRSSNSSSNINARSSVGLPSGTTLSMFPKPVNSGAQVEERKRPGQGKVAPGLKAKWAKQGAGGRSQGGHTNNAFEGSDTEDEEMSELSTDHETTEDEEEEEGEMGERTVHRSGYSTPETKAKEIESKIAQAVNTNAQREIRSKTDKYEKFNAEKEVIDKQISNIQAAIFKEEFGIKKDEEVVVLLLLLVMFPVPVLSSFSCTSGCGSAGRRGQQNRREIGKDYG